MKKTILILILIMPFMVKADINKIFIDSEVDISGNLIVKEIIETDSNESITLDIPYKNIDAKEYKENDIVKDDSIIYNGHNIQINKVGTLDKEYDINSLYKEELDVKEYKDYTEEDDAGYKKITFNKNSDKNIYYLEYLVLCVSVKHNDSAELYYPYFRASNQNIKEIVIMTRLPYTSKLFEVYAHGKRNIEVSKDTKDPIVLTKINNLKNKESFSLRILYDKDIFKIAINDSKKSNIDAIDLIKNIEKEKQTTTNFLNIYKYLSIPIIIVLIVVFFLLKRKKKWKKH
mgnify:CR=1 FL=1